jgi:transposase-like protein
MTTRKSKVAGELRIVSQYGIVIDKTNDIRLKCPKCEHYKPVSEYGFRNVGDGVIYNQPWCTECRNAG